MQSCSPSCHSRHSTPISLRASTLIGGVFTSPCNQRSGFPFVMVINDMPILTYRQLVFNLACYLNLSGKFLPASSLFSSLPSVKIESFRLGFPLLSESGRSHSSFVVLFQMMPEQE